MAPLSSKKLFARLERISREIDDIKAHLLADEEEGDDADEDEAMLLTGCYALFLILSEDASATYPFITEFVLDEDNVLWFNYLTRSKRQTLLDFAPSNQEAWWPDQGDGESALDYIRRLQQFDGVETRSVVVSEWSAYEMKGRFEYDAKTGEIVEHVPLTNRAGNGRVLTSITGGRGRRDGE